MLCASNCNIHQPGQSVYNLKDFAGDFATNRKVPPTFLILKYQLVRLLKTYSRYYDDAKQEILLTLVSIYQSEETISHNAIACRCGRRLRNVFSDKPKCVGIGNYELVDKQDISNMKDWLGARPELLHIAEYMIFNGGATQKELMVEFRLSRKQVRSRLHDIENIFVSESNTH